MNGIKYEPILQLECHLKELKEQALSKEIPEIDRKILEMNSLIESLQLELNQIEKSLDEENEKLQMNIKEKEEISKLDSEIKELQKEYSKKKVLLHSEIERESYASILISSHPHILESSFSLAKYFESINQVHVNHLQTLNYESKIKESISNLQEEFQNEKHSFTSSEAEKILQEILLEALTKDFLELKSQNQEIQASTETQKAQIRNEIKKLELEYMSLQSSFTTKKKELMEKTLFIKNSEKLDLDNLHITLKQLEIDVAQISGLDFQTVALTKNFDEILTQNESLKMKIYQQELFLCEHAISLQKSPNKAVNSRFIR